MAITSESQIIDKSAVVAACNLIREGAEYFTKASTEINNAATHCGSNALAVDGKNMQEDFIELMSQLNDLKQKIDNFCLSVEQAADEVIENQRQQLQAYRESQKQSNN